MRIFESGKHLEISILSSKSNKSKRWDRQPLREKSPNQSFSTLKKKKKSAKEKPVFCIVFIMDQMFLFYNSNQQNCGSSSFAKSSGIRKSNGLLTPQSVRNKSIDWRYRNEF